MSWELGVSVSIIGIGFILLCLIRSLDERHISVKLLYHAVILFLIYTAFGLGIQIINAQTSVAGDIITDIVSIFASLLFVMGLIIYTVFGYVLFISIRGILLFRKEERARDRGRQFGN